MEMGVCIMEFIKGLLWRESWSGIGMALFLCLIA
jgi:hypothetical protein